MIPINDIIDGLVRSLDEEDSSDGSRIRASQVMTKRRVEESIRIEAK